MQSYDSNDKMKISKLINDFQEVGNELTKPDVAYVKVGHIPEIGHEFETNGLKFKVIMSNARKGRFTAEIL